MPQAKKSEIEAKLKELGEEAEERDAQRRAEKDGFPYADLITTPISVEALDLIPEKEARKNKIAAIEVKNKKLALAAYDPESKGAKEIINSLKQKGYDASLFIASQRGLDYAFGFYRFITKEAVKITGRVDILKEKLLELKGKLSSLEKVKKSLEEVGAEDFYAAEILEIILAGALANEASDIHLEPEEHKIKLRMRIDGFLHDVFDELKPGIYKSLISRIKLLSKLKLNVTDEPQDGRFTIGLGDKEIEIRTSTLPSEFGETVVMRVLDPGTIMLELKNLGLREDDLEIVNKELEKPNGMILNTGPTGSGKTTTLYAFLSRTAKPEIKTITIEDPIEYHLPGIEQTQVDPEAGYTFASGLRSILRQDPDIILVGEIRDLETSEIAMHAALTGHLVFSTLHTNEAAGAIPRLVDMGVKPSIIAPAVNLIIAQRLVRRLCEHCKEEEKIPAELAEKIKVFLGNLPPRVKKENYKNYKVYKPKGCDRCNSAGYKGRVGVFEFLLMNDDLERLIAEKPIEVEVKNLALKSGMVTVGQDGVLRVLSGETTLDEVERITGPIEW